MPGYVMHLAACERLLDKLKISDIRFKALFRIGNIIPDVMERDNKQKSHFWDDAMMDRFVRKPDLSNFLKQYGKDMKDPYIFGYYSHLVLDRNYLDYYWKKHFRFYNENNEEDEYYDTIKRVLLLDNNVMYDRDDFFSERLYYGDYDRANEYILNKYDVDYEECKNSLEIIHREDLRYNLGYINVQDSVDKLSDMISLIKRDSTTGSQAAPVYKETLHSPTYPKLNVLDIRDMEILIENTVDDIVSML